MTFAALRPFLVFSVALMLLLSCSKKEDLDPDLETDTQSENDRIILESFTHGEFFSQMKSFEDVDCETYCIINSPESWVMKESNHRFNAQFSIDLKIYNTPTDIIYAFHIKSGNNSRPVIGTLNGKAVNAPTYELKTPKETDWSTCELIENQFTITRGAGNPLVINASYKLFEKCK